MVTTEANLDPAVFGPQPPWFHTRFLCQSNVLPCSDLVVCHGGSGTVVGALAHGAPLIVLPMGADQPINAGRVAALGAGRRLDVVRATSDDVAATARAVLADPRYRRNAEALRDECRALPGPDHGADLIVRLGEERCPLLAVPAGSMHKPAGTRTNRPRRTTVRPPTRRSE